MSSKHRYTLKQFFKDVGPVSSFFMTLSVVLLGVGMALNCLPLTIPAMLSSLIGLITAR